MKKSNKLLLGGFLVLVLLISAIHITLFAKYKAGNYTIHNSEEDLIPLPMQSFPNILFVSVRNVPSASVKFSDVAQVQKGEEEYIKYIRKGDTLLITGTDSSSDKGIRQHIAFNIPNNAIVSAFNSRLSFEKSKKTAANNSTIYLDKSQATFSGDQSPFLLGNIKVVASNNSLAFFQDKIQVNNLEVQLSKSSLEWGEGNFNQLSIITDSVSRLSLQSKHLLKANIKTITPQ